MKLDYKKTAMLQFVSINIVTIILFLIFIICVVAVNNPMYFEETLQTGLIGIIFFMPLGVISFLALAIVGTISLVLSLIILMLSLIALLLNKRNPNIKKWNISRILNSIILLIFGWFIYIMFSNAFVVIILSVIILLNIYLMFFNKKSNN